MKQHYSPPEWDEVALMPTGVICSSQLEDESSYGGEEIVIE